jgi:superfamily I DNA/RNA helicase
MELTQEQYDIINSTGNIKINAVAGSGKTTTIIEYAMARPKGSKILYLAFNKSVKLDAIKKFMSKGLDNVQVETAHSLAYRSVVTGSNYKVRHQGYKSYEIAEILNLHGNGEKITDYIIANHINKFVAYFCNSNVQKIQDLNYLDVVSDKKANLFVKTHYNYIEKQTRLLLSKMDKSEIEITHDFYLKKFQLSNPKLIHDYILFDEGQDASPAMLDIFMKQKATKVIVGDAHQQIYGWRYAVNSLEKTDYKAYNLSTSFRFSQDIADLAMEIIQWKKHLSEFKPVSIKGVGNNDGHKTKAVLARTNLGLLLKAIEYVMEKKEVKQIYFEGNINSYTYADDGASLYDVLNLNNGKHFLIKDKLIKAMKNMFELEDYIKKTEDVQLGMMVEIVNEYGDKIPDIIKAIKAKHVENDEKEKAEIIFSTVHRSKGMEYDTVQLVNDFITEDKLAKNEIKEEGVLSKLNEEINLLYVAVTRTKNSIYIPEQLLSLDYPGSSHIHLMHISNVEEIKESGTIKKRFSIPLKNGINRSSLDDNDPEITIKEMYYKNASTPWTSEQDDELTVMYCEGVNERDMARHFKRTTGGIRSRIKKLELADKYG